MCPNRRQLFESLVVKNLLSMCLAAALLANGSFVAAAPLAGMTTFEPPVKLTPAGSSPEFGQHAVTRLVDSLDLPSTYLYRHRNGAVHLARTEATLTRNDQGHIKSITIGGRTYEFDLDANGLVERVKEREPR